MSPDRQSLSASPSSRPTAISAGPDVPRRHLLRGVIGLGALATTSAVVTACSSPGADTTSRSATAPVGPGPAGAPASGSPGHVHAAAFAPDGAHALIATHTGLYTLAGEGSTTAGEHGPTLARIGPQIDLMGFTVAPDGAYLASGHPDPSVGLPQPMGLARSTDQGRTWQVISRGGDSDFHTLTASTRGVLAYDGVLRFSPDLRTWQTRTIPAPPRMLSAHHDTGHALATTEQGLLLSVDDGLGWQMLSPPAFVTHAVWAAADTVVAITTDRVLVLSRDSGTTWLAGPAPVAVPAGAGELGPATALACRVTSGRPATPTPAGTSTPTSTLAQAPPGPPEVLVVVGHLAVLTRDLGVTSELLR